MKNLRPLSALLISLALIALPSCSGKAPEAGKKPVVVVSILPQKYFVERIAGSRVEVAVLVGAGQSPHSYEPTPRQMDQLSKASAWFSIKVDFEKGLKPKVAALYPGLPIVDTTVGIQYRMLEAHHHEGAQETAQEAGTEVGNDEEESGPDEHVWLGREAAKVIAMHIRDELASLDPAGRPTYEVNCAALVQDIEATHTALASALLPLKGQKVFVFHPAFGYFLDDYGIEQEAVEINGKEPTPRALNALVAEAKKDGAKVIFVQAQFSQTAARTIADAIGGAVIPIDPLAPDWLSNLTTLGEAMKNAIH